MPARELLIEACCESLIAIVGYVQSPDGTTTFAVIWQNGGVTNLRTLPGDFAAFATGINNRGQVVGSTFDSSFSLRRDLDSGESGNNGMRPRVETIGFMRGSTGTCAPI